MENLKRIIEHNRGIEFVVMTHNKEEYIAFRNIVINEGFEYAIIPDEYTCSRDIMDSLAEDYDYCGGWRVSESRGIAFNESLEHWKEYNYDILEVCEDGELHFVDEED
jgi:hypothetical protein